MTTTATTTTPTATGTALRPRTHAASPQAPPLYRDRHDERAVAGDRRARGARDRGTADGTGTADSDGTDSDGTAASDGTADAHAVAPPIRSGARCRSAGDARPATARGMVSAGGRWRSRSERASQAPVNPVGDRFRCDSTGLHEPRLPILILHTRSSKPCAK